MKIKITEEQYNRLLVENDKDFLDGQVNFKHIGNKVTPFIVKLYNIIAKKSEMTWDAQVGMVKNDFQLSEAESILLIYNFNNFKAQKGITDNFSEVLGEPLEYYGKFVYDTTLPVYGTVWGYIDGVAEGYGTSYEDFIAQLRDGMFDVSADWRRNVTADTYDVDWELQEPHANEKIVDDVADEDDSEIIDRITIG